jgi:serine/threonine-protein kinase
VRDRQARGAAVTPPPPSSEYRRALARFFGLGAVLVPLFFPVDLVMSRVLYPDASLPRALGLRALATAGALIARWVARSPRFGERAVRIAHAAALANTAAAFSGMAATFGGPASAYVHGLTVVMMVRSATVAAPFSNALGYGLLMAGVYALGLAVRYAIDPAAHASWVRPEELAWFTAHYLLVIASIGCGALASRAAWLAQKQLFQARRLGRYRLQAPIGRGGQGEVWLARDPAAGRNVALKVLRGSDASPVELRLFEREAELASRLESPHTVRIYDFGASDDGVYFLAMEHLDGADLRTLCRGHGPMPAGRAVRFAIQACRSLEEAHGKRLVHRDIKPSNLFAARIGDAFDHLKVLDFGIARSLEDDERLTRTGAVRGTPAYLAPERCRGLPATPAADLYGLGATLYELLTGAPPFTGDDAEVIGQQLAATPAPVRARAPAIDAEVERIVMRCLAKEPRERFASAAELRAALEACAAAAAWTPADAARFWLEERRAALARWEAETAA